MTTVQLIPASVSYMQTADPHVVQREWFIMACHDWINWKRACGLVFEAQDPERFCLPGDLQTLCNVVSWWPKDAPIRLRPPSLALFLEDLPIRDDVTITFSQRLQIQADHARTWVSERGGNVDNPNESKEERARRKNRERQRAWQMRNAEGSDDPELHRLIQLAKHEAEQLTQAKAWLKRELSAARVAEQAAIAAAKAARANRISELESAVAGQEKAMLDAKAIVDAYKANK